MDKNKSYLVCIQNCYSDIKKYLGINYKGVFHLNHNLDDKYNLAFTTYDAAENYLYYNFNRFKYLFNDNDEVFIYHHIPSKGDNTI